MLNGHEIRAAVCQQEGAPLMYKHARAAQDYSPSKRKWKNGRPKKTVSKRVKRVKEALLAEERRQERLEARRRESRAARAKQAVHKEDVAAAENSEREGLRVY